MGISLAPVRDDLRELGAAPCAATERARGRERWGEPLPEHIERQLRMRSVVVEQTKAADK